MDNKTYYFIVGWLVYVTHLMQIFTIAENWRSYVDEGVKYKQDALHLLYLKYGDELQLGQV